MTRLIKITLLVVIAISLVACSATPTRRSFKEGWKDSVVSTKVKYKLTTDKLVKKRNIDVDTWRGVVTMTGRVTSMEEKERAEQLAWQAAGVRGVENYLNLVDDAYMEAPTEVIAEGEVETTTVEKIKTADGTTTITDKKDETVVVTEKKKASHPMKQMNSSVNNRVDSPIVYEDIESQTKNQTSVVARRGRYNRPQASEIQETDLTDEERLAQEAAEELRKLRGEE